MGFFELTSVLYYDANIMQNNRRGEKSRDVLSSLKMHILRMIREKSGEPENSPSSREQNTQANLR